MAESTARVYTHRQLFIDKFRSVTLISIAADKRTISDRIAPMETPVKAYGPPGHSMSSDRLKDNTVPPSAKYTTLALINFSQTFPLSFPTGIGSHIIVASYILQFTTGGVIADALSGTLSSALAAADSTTQALIVINGVPSTFLHLTMES
ncbi:hypothetical protein LguiB_017089 [Lonicera macranthoides]